MPFTFEHVPNTIMMTHKINHNLTSMIARFEELFKTVHTIKVTQKGIENKLDCL